MASLDTFNELPMNQRVGIICGVGAVVAIVLGYMLYSDLGKLGPDREGVLSFMSRDTSPSLWGDINTLEEDITRLNIKANKLKDYQAELEELNKEIAIAIEILPTKRERSKIGETLGEFAKSVVSENLGIARLKSTDIQARDRNSGAVRRRGPAPKVQAEKITFKCRLFCDMNGLIAFINKVENDNLFLTVDSIRLTPGDVSADLDENIAEYKLHEAVLEINTWVLEGVKL